MDLVLCHMTADFDTLGAAVGVTRLRPGARIVLTGGAHPTVRNFLALHRDEYPLIERRSVSPDKIRTITVVDTQWSDRLGKAAEWLSLPNVEITVYDHHGGTDAPEASKADDHATETDIAADHRYVEPVGAASTLVAEHLQRKHITLNPIEATVMALGIHVDTGSLTFGHTTVRDAAALTWLMQQGANPRVISEYVEPGLSPELQDMVPIAIRGLQSKTVNGITVAWVMLSVDGYVVGLSGLTSQVMSLTDCDVLLVAARYPMAENDERLTIIGRSRAGAFSTAHLDAVNLGSIFQAFGGGGHPRAAAVTLRSFSPDQVLDEVIQQVMAQIPHPPTARDLMSSPVRTVRPDITIAEAHRILLRYGHSGLSIVDEGDRLVGVISRRDLDIALHHDFSHAPVKGFMSTNVKTISPQTSLPDIESLMVTYDIGRLPVVDGDALVGIVTRTDVLRQLHHEHRLTGQPDELDSDVEAASVALSLSPRSIQALMGDRLNPAVWMLLGDVAVAAEERGWHLYLVGGAVRDLILARTSGRAAVPNQSSTESNGDDIEIDDIDLVVDGFHQSADDAAGVELARVLQSRYPTVKLQIHGRFQTAALTWHNDPTFDSLWMDIATARTEFYPYPAANPEVEASSIRQDLYRRDFTINALAIRLTRPQAGELLDFFGGVIDLDNHQIRVLHTNSFIEDPTRIFRAVRFAVRLGFSLEPQTEDYIHHAIASGVYRRIQSEIETVPALQTRLKRELKYILEAPYWHSAIQLLNQLDALQCIHPDLRLTDELWRQLKLAARCLNRFDVNHNLAHWAVLLDVLLAALPDGDRPSVATQLQLSDDSIQRLSDLSTLEHDLQALLTCDRPSQQFQRLQALDIQTLILIAVRSDRPLRRIIWRHLTCWMQLELPIDGKDLKTMGYKPGPHFRTMLEALQSEVLDGRVGDRAEAEQFIRDHF
jgi:tRNA nucleotidyltransferase (CCA-adding enzyme)